jgi:hypothetical protein
MRPDNTAAIITAARHRRELTRSKAIRALRELDAAGTPVTFETVARAAGVSRSWLYAQPDIRAQIERLREATRRAPSPAIPAGQRASSASLLTRLHAALERNRELAAENQRLRRQLAHALGRQRSNNDHRPPAEAQHGHPGLTTTPSTTQRPRSQP